MTRFQSFFNLLRIPGLKKTRLIVALGADMAWVWFDGAIYNKTPQLGYDPSSDRYFLLSPNVLARSNGGNRFQTIKCLEGGKVLDIVATQQFLKLWLQELIPGIHSWNQFLSGTFIIPTQLSAAQLQIYKLVFQGVPGSWNDAPVSDFLPTLLEQESQLKSCGTILSVHADYSEINILSNHTVISTRTFFLGTDEMLRAIDQVLREQYRLVTERTTLAQLYQEIATTTDPTTEKRISIRGKDLTTSLPQNCVVELSRFAAATELWLNKILQEIHLTYSQLSTSELSLLQQDVGLIGMGAYFQPLAALLRQALTSAVIIPPKPEKSIMKIAPYVIN